MSGWHILSSYCFDLFKLHSFFRLVRMATLDTSFRRISLHKLFLTAKAVNLQFSLNVAIFNEESISNRLTSRYSEFHYTFAVKGFLHYFWHSRFCLDWSRPLRKDQVHSFMATLSIYALTLIHPSPKLFVCNLPDSRRQMTRPNHGLSTARRENLGMRLYLPVSRNPDLSMKS